MKKQTIYYRVANLNFELSIAKDMSTQELLPNFSPFIVHNGVESDIVSRIVVAFEERDISISGAKLLSDVSITWAEHFRFYDLGQQYLIQIKAEKGGPGYHMVVSKDFTAAQIYTQKEIEINEFNIMLSWFLMMVFAQVAVFHQRILIHASVVEREAEAYAFLGKSGTGKSTHSSLWIRYLSGFKLLNDDNPAVQVKDDGTIAVFGTPWSGKTACYRNEERILKGFVRLQQFESNHFYPKSDRAAFVAMLPSCSGIRWNKHIFSTMVGVLTKIVQSVPIGELACLPDREAAVLSYNNIINNSNLI